VSKKQGGKEEGEASKNKSWEEKRERGIVVHSLLFGW
jgi:hypothetical protein